MALVSASPAGRSPARAILMVGEPILAVALWVCAAAVPAGATPPGAAVEARMVLKVRDVDAAADALVGAARAEGGYFAVRTEHELQLRVPAARLDDLLAKASGLGLVVEKKITSEYLAGTVNRDRARLASREKLLEQYLAVLGAAGTSANVTSVEKEVAQLVEAIEQTRGAIEAARHRIELATLDVSFRLRERRAVRPVGGSSFPWINTLNLPDLLEDFRHAPR